MAKVSVVQYGGGIVRDSNVPRWWSNVKSGSGVVVSSNARRWQSFALLGIAAHGAGKENQEKMKEIGALLGWLNAQLGRCSVNIKMAVRRGDYVEAARLDVEKNVYEGIVLAIRTNEFGGDDTE